MAIVETTKYRCSNGHEWEEGDKNSFFIRFGYDRPEKWCAACIVEMLRGCGIGTVEEVRDSQQEGT